MQPEPYNHFCMINQSFHLFLYWLVNYNWKQVRHCNDLEIPRHKAAVLVGYISIAQSVSRVCFGRVNDHPRVNRVYVFQFSVLACSVLTTILPVMTSHSALLVYCWLYGIGDGCFSVLLAVLTGDIVGTKKFASALGFLYSITAFSMMLGPVAAGELSFHTG